MVGWVGLVRRPIANSGAGTKRRKKSIVSLHFFGSTSTISRFGDRFCDGQYSLVSFLIAVFLLTMPAVPSHL